MCALNLTRFRPSLDCGYCFVSTFVFVYGLLLLFRCIFVAIWWLSGPFCLLRGIFVIVHDFESWLELPRSTNDIWMQRASRVHKWAKENGSERAKMGRSWAQLHPAFNHFWLNLWPFKATLPHLVTCSLLCFFQILSKLHCCVRELLGKALFAHQTPNSSKYATLNLKFSYKLQIIIQNHAIWICLVNLSNWIGAFSLACVCLKLLNAFAYLCLCEPFATCLINFGANLNELCHCKLSPWRRWWIVACHAHVLLNCAYALLILVCWW